MSLHRFFLMAALMALAPLVASTAQARGGVPRARVETYRKVLAQGIPRGASRAERKAYGNLVRKAFRRAGRANMRDLKSLMRQPNLTVNRTRSSAGSAQLSLEGRDHMAKFAGGKLSLRLKNFTTTPSLYAGENGHSFNFTRHGIKARDTISKKKVILDYDVHGMVGLEGGAVKVKGLAVKPVGHALTYQFRPGVREMKAMLEDVGREMARMYPSSKTLVLDRYRATTGYTGAEKKRVKTYDLDLFRR